MAPPTWSSSYPSAITIRNLSQTGRLPIGSVPMTHSLMLIFPIPCAENISAGLFWQLLGAMKRTGSKDAYHGWNKDTPILLLSGQEDPVGDYGKGVLSVKQRMEKAGIRSVSMQLFPNARHDLLHEESTAAPSARDSLLDWISCLL